MFLADLCQSLERARSRQTSQVAVLPFCIALYKALLAVGSFRLITVRVTLACVVECDYRLLSLLFCSSPVAVFLRFLLLVSSHSWDTDPLIINFNHSLSGQLVIQLSTSLPS